MFGVRSHKYVLVGEKHCSGCVGLYAWGEEKAILTTFWSGRCTTAICSVSKMLQVQTLPDRPRMAEYRRF